jgi:hypothetical protein
MHRLTLLLVATLILSGCTTRYQVRGTENILDSTNYEDLIGQSEIHRARQISMEHQSIEKYNGFSLGIIEISDEGAVNPRQKKQVMDWIEQETSQGGLLIVFVHGWHHGARTCDRDLCCFRAALSELKKARAGKRGAVVGLFLGWRGESLPYSGWNVLTLWDRKRVAEHIGRTAGKEILLELEERVWNENPDLTMVSIGHSLGGALLFQAVKGRLTGNISDIELGKVRSYRVVRTEESRVDALRWHEKARRAGFGELVVLVNPAIEASEYKVFDNDLKDNNVNCSGPPCRAELVRKLLPYDKEQPFPQLQMPVLMTVASEADTAVGRIFPVARWIEALIRPRYFARPYWTGMGHYGPQMTHRLEAPKRQASPQEAVSGNCGCPKMVEGLQDIGAVEVQLTSSAGVEDIGGGLKFGLTQKRLERGWDTNSPYLVIQANEGVISEHSDIFNPSFVAFLRAYIDAYDQKYETLPPEVKRGDNK